MRIATEQVLSGLGGCFNGVGFNLFLIDREIVELGGNNLFLALFVAAYNKPDVGLAGMGGETWIFFFFAKGLAEQINTDKI